MDICEYTVEEGEGGGGWLLNAYRRLVGQSLAKCENFHDLYFIEGVCYTN
jgi:hypothetical protein